MCITIILQCLVPRWLSVFATLSYQTPIISLPLHISLTLEVSSAQHQTMYRVRIQPIRRLYLHLADHIICTIQNNTAFHNVSLASIRFSYPFYLYSYVIYFHVVTRIDHHPRRTTSTSRRSMFSLLWLMKHFHHHNHIGVIRIRTHPHSVYVCLISSQVCVLWYFILSFPMMTIWIKQSFEEQTKNIKQTHINALSQPSSNIYSDDCRIDYYMYISEAHTWVSARHKAGCRRLMQKDCESSAVQVGVWIPVFNSRLSACMMLMLPSRVYWMD